jgi:hypothetical protein
MRVDWSIECGADDPVLVVPWEDPDNPSSHFVDLRENPYDLDQIAEAEHYPPIMQALRALNATRSPVLTAKCDAWPMASDEVEHTQLNLDILPADAPHGFTSYIDLVWRDRPVFLSIHHQEQRIQRLARLLDPIDAPYAAVDCILRPAFVDIAGPQEGFAVSLYLKALGYDAPQAYEHWSRALESVVTVIRGREFASS